MGETAGLELGISDSVHPSLGFVTCFPDHPVALSQCQGQSLGGGSQGERDTVGGEHPAGTDASQGGGIRLPRLFTAQPKGLLLA